MERFRKPPTETEGEKREMNLGGREGGRKTQNAKRKTQNAKTQNAKTQNAKTQNENR